MLLREQMQGDDVVATAIAAEAALQNVDECEEAARVLLAAKVARLREAGLWHLVGHHHDAAAAIEHGLVDRAAGVRNLARGAAAQHGTDPVTWYRSHVDTDLASSLLGLGDIGTEQDVALALDHLDDSDRRTRAAAIRLISRKGGSAGVPQLIDVAVGEPGGLAREAIGGIVRQGVTDELVSALWERLERGGSAPAWRRVSRGIFPHASRWTSLGLGLKEVRSKDEHVRDVGRDLLIRVRWSWNRSQTPPRPGQLAELRILLSRAAPLLRNTEPKLLRELEDLLRHDW
jgi:hypothetical protein